MIYLDYAATTPCIPEVLDAMAPFFREQFANASSVDHLLGSRAKAAVEKARERVALLVNAQPEEVIFTSGSTEANNLALSTDLPVLTSPVEHPSVLDTFRARRRVDDGLLEIDQDGLIAQGFLTTQLKKGPHVCSIITTNNETGVEQDLDKVANIISEGGSLLHVDATQTVGTRNIDFRKGNISACSVSAHKIYGPKGIGALIVSNAARRYLHPILQGGGHERGLRSGTLNVPAIVGFGVAAELAKKHREGRRSVLLGLRKQFLTALARASSHEAKETIQSAPTSPHILSIRIPGINARALLRAVHEDVAFSLGSACATNKATPSHVLTALGLERPRIAETIRCSFSFEQTLDEVERAAKAIGNAARGLAEYSMPA